MNKAQKDANLSVVIATLGGCHLTKTLDSLNRGSIIPSEIIISIPAERANSMPLFNHTNVKVNLCEKFGQVSQRAEGFKLASGDFILQLDDDVIVDYNCLMNLLRSMKKLNGSVSIAPSIFSSQTGKSIFVKDTSGITRKIYYWLINGKLGYQPGKFYLSGSADGVVHQKSGINLLQSDWLSGGCVLHKKTNVITENYFPYPGKAYCEDFIHSFLLTQKGINLFVDSNAKVFIEIESYTNQTVISFFRGLIPDFRARHYFMTLSKRKSLRIYFFYSFIIFNYFTTFTIRNFKNWI